MSPAVDSRHVEASEAQNEAHANFYAAALARSMLVLATMDSYVIHHTTKEDWKL
jgi:hypothetical protein